MTKRDGKFKVYDEITVETASSQYNVYTGRGILKVQNGGVHDRLPKIEKAMVVVDSTVYKLHREKIDAFLSAVVENAHLIELDSEEQLKSWEQAGQLLYRAAEHQLHRFSWFIGIGGGVIGDLLGFVAATYMRGSYLMHIPTTLLAQVDSSIGGKVAVNHGGYKNSVGTFYHPTAVISDSDFIKTLPKRELISGLAEVFKYGILKNRELFDRARKIFMENELVQQSESLWTEAVPDLITASCQIKAQIVGTDERDLSDRMLLNLGHTFAHILEAQTEYQYFKHGEAVAWGLAFAADLAHQKRLLAEDEYLAVSEIPKLMSVPKIPESIKSKSQLCALLMRDKKVDNGGLRVILPTSIGSADIYYCQPSELADTILKWR